MTYRAALITGASSGIGESFARLLPDTTDLLLTGRQAAALSRLASDLERPGRRVQVIVADLSRSEDIQTLSAAAEAFEIDLLINNAGLGHFGPVVANPRESETEIVMVNVVAPALLTNALLPGMLRRAEVAGRRAGIVIVASVVSFFAVPKMATYAATKAFDLIYAVGLAEEMRARPVEILALCPGSTATRFAERAGSAARMASLGHSADRVAAAGLAALGHRTIIVVGAGNWVVTTIARLLPTTWFARLVALVLG